MVLPDNGYGELSGSVASSKAAHMDIGKAKSLYIECGPDLSKEYESVVSFCRENQISAPLANGNFLHALTLTDLLFHHANDCLSMLTGGAGDGFIACLQKSFREMLVRLKSNQGKARVIIVDGTVEKGLLDSLQREFPKTLHVVRASAGQLIPHFIVADGEMVRDEQVHPPLCDKSDANVIKADVYFHAPAIAGIFTRRFDGFWKRLVGEA